VLLNPTDAEPAEYLAENDVPHRFVASGIWQLPMGRRRALSLGRIGNAILGDISVQGIFNLQSGRPVSFGNLYYNGDPSKLKANYNNPDAVFDTSGFYFSDSNAATPATQRTDPRIRLANNVRTFPFRPGLRTAPVSFLDVSLVKTVNFTEDVRLQLRFEAINALNHPVFDRPNVDPTNANFGKSTAQFNLPRNLQLAAKLMF